MSPWTRAGLTVLLLGPCAAFPCSGHTCEQFFNVVPALGGGTVPANAPAIGVNRTLYGESSWDGGTGQNVPTSALTIRKVDGGTVGWIDGGTNSEPWALLDQSLVEGDQLWVEATMGVAACEQRGVLRVGPWAPFPLTPAVIALANFEMLENTGGMCGGPTGLVEHAQLTATPTAEMTPWLALTRWELEVDGQNYTASNFGRLTAGAQTGIPSTSGPHRLLSLHAQCGPSATDGGAALDARLGPGPHQVRLLARIVGIPTALPSNTITVDFQCDTTVPDAGEPMEIDAGSTPAVDTTPDAGAPPTQSPPPNSRGCSSIDELSIIALIGALLRRPRKQAAQRA
jgi:hypothetical protein